MDELPIAKMGEGKKYRVSVSAEAYGIWNKPRDFEPPKYPKPEDIKSQIKARLNQAFMFSALNEEELSIVIDAMQVRKVLKDETVITEGEDGDNLYVVEMGCLTCTKVINQVATFLKTYLPGDAFGELALLYNAPRAATIKAKIDSDLWSLDRETFTHIVKDAASKKRERYEAFLEKVKILQSMDAYER